MLSLEEFFRDGVAKLALNNRIHYRGFCDFHHNAPSRGKVSSTNVPPVGLAVRFTEVLP